MECEAPFPSPALTGFGRISLSPHSPQHLHKWDQFAQFCLNAFLDILEDPFGKDAWQGRPPGARAPPDTPCSCSRMTSQVRGGGRPCRQQPMHDGAVGLAEMTESAGHISDSTRNDGKSGGFDSHLLRMLSPFLPPSLRIPADGP